MSDIFSPVLANDDPLGFWRQTSEYRRMMSQAHSEHQQAQLRHIEKIESLEAARDVKSREAVKAERVADKRVRRLRAELAKAESDQHRAHGERTTIGDICRRKINAEKRALVALADPRIDRFIEELEVLVEETRHSPIDESKQTGTFDIIAEVFRRPKTLKSNWPSKNARVQALRVAQRAAENLKLRIVEDIDAELTKLRAGIPSGNELVEV